MPENNNSLLDLTKPEDLAKFDAMLAEQTTPAWWERELAAPLHDAYTEAVTDVNSKLGTPLDTYGHIAGDEQSVEAAQFLAKTAHQAQEDNDTTKRYLGEMTAEEHAASHKANVEQLANEVDEAPRVVNNWMDKISDFIEKAIEWVSELVDKVKDFVKDTFGMGDNDTPPGEHTAPESPSPQPNGATPARQLDKILESSEIASTSPDIQEKNIQKGDNLTPIPVITSMETDKQMSL